MMVFGLWSMYKHVYVNVWCAGFRFPLEKELIRTVSCFKSISTASPTKLYARSGNLRWKWPVSLIFKFYPRILRSKEVCILALYNSSHYPIFQFPDYNSVGNSFWDGVWPTYFRFISSWLCMKLVFTSYVGSDLYLELQYSTLYN